MQRSIFCRFCSFQTTIPLTYVEYAQINDGQIKRDLRTFPYIIADNSRFVNRFNSQKSFCEENCRIFNIFLQKPLTKQENCGISISGFLVEVAVIKSNTASIHLTVALLCERVYRRSGEYRFSCWDGVEYASDCHNICGELSL